MSEGFQRLIFSLVTRFGVRRNLRLLVGSGNGRAGFLHDAVRFTERGELSPAEREWILNIERLRASLGSSPTVVKPTDHGAGAAGQVRTVGQICRGSAISSMWGLFLFNLVRRFRPSSCIELGTSLGISASFLGAACELNGRGHVTTLEGDPVLASLAEQNFATLGCSRISVVRGPFEETLLPVLHRTAPVDFAFIDGNHAGDATKRYFNEIRMHLSATGVMVFDDILWSKEMYSAWKYIGRSASPSQTVSLGRMGIFLNESRGL